MSFLVYGGKKKNSATPLHCPRIFRAKGGPIAPVHSVLKDSVSCSSVASPCEGRTSDFVLSAVEVEHWSSLTGRDASVVFNFLLFTLPG